MEKTTTNYFCDCCKKQVESSKDLFQTPVAGKDYDEEGRSFKKTFYLVNCCKSCMEAIWDVMQEYCVAVAEPGGNHIEMKEKK